MSHVKLSTPVSPNGKTVDWLGAEGVLALGWDGGKVGYWTGVTGLGVLPRRKLRWKGMRCLKEGTP